MATVGTLAVREIDAFYWNERPHIDPATGFYVVHVGPNRADRRRFLGGNLGRSVDHRAEQQRHRAYIARAMALKTAP